MKSRPHRILLLVVAFLSAFGASLAGAQDGHGSASGSGRPAWSERALELFASLPVQDGGRVKPLDTTPSSGSCASTASAS